MSIRGLMTYLLTKEDNYDSTAEHGLDVHGFSTRDGYGLLADAW